MTLRNWADCPSQATTDFPLFCENYLFQVSAVRGAARALSSIIIVVVLYVLGGKISIHFCLDTESIAPTAGLLDPENSIPFLLPRRAAACLPSRAGVVVGT